MQMARRRLGLFLALAGAVLYFAAAGKPNHRFVLLTGIVMVISGLLFTICAGINKAHRSSLLPCGIALLVIILSISLGPRSSRGIYVFITQESLARAADEPTGPLLVLLRPPRTSSSQPSRVFVNDRETDWHNLRGALLSQLSVRPDWVVFVDADPSLPYSDLVHAVDVVTQLSAKPVLLSLKLWLWPRAPTQGHRSPYLSSQQAVIFRDIAVHN